MMMQGGRKKSFWIMGLEKNYIALGLLKIVKIEKKLADPPLPPTSKRAKNGEVENGRFWGGRHRQKIRKSKKS